MSDIEISFENDSSIQQSRDWLINPATEYGDYPDVRGYRDWVGPGPDPYGEQDPSYIAGSNNIVPHTSPVNPLIWKQHPNGESDPYLMFAPHCENCGKPVECYEGMPYWWIYALQRFLCAECEDLDYGYFLYWYRKVQSGEWTREQAEEWVKSIYDDEGPYYF